MDLLTIDFDVLMAIVIGAFALTGFFRGWWREGLTTILLLVLVIFLTQPNVVSSIVEYINNLLEIFGLVTETGGELSVANLQAAAATAEPPVEIQAGNRNVYIILMLVLVILSYFGSRLTLPGSGPGSFQPSAGARIAGAVIGAFNGFIVMNLFMEYIIGRRLPETAIASNTAAPSTVAIQIAQVPPESIFDGPTLVLIIGFGIVVLALILVNRIKPSQHISGVTPLGYKQED